MADLTPGEKAAERGVPSLVWRAGQARRLAMIGRAAGERLGNGHILDVGCGVGMYLRAFGPLVSPFEGGEFSKSGDYREHNPHVFGVEIEAERVRQAATYGHVVQSPGERLPFAADSFDLVLSHEVIEHVADDRACVADMVRVLRGGGRLVLFCPNRLYPFETHGHYWRGRYHFGNTPLVNYLPDRLRNRMVPHVRAYTVGTLRRLFDGLPVRILSHVQIYPGYDNLVARRPAWGRVMRSIAYRLEQTPMRIWGLSHFLVVEKQSTNG